MIHLKNIILLNIDIKYCWRRDCIVIWDQKILSYKKLASKDSHSDNVFESMRLNLGKYGPDKIHMESG